MIKTLTNLFKQDKEKFVVPKGVQDVIPIKAIYDDGIFQVGKDKFSKSFKFTDINYAVASREDKEAMFLEYSELLNSFDSGATTKITINNRRLNRLDFEKTILLPLKGDELDVYREEYNKMLLEKATGANAIVQDKYITISINKKNIEEARNYFARVGADLIAHFGRLGSKCTELETDERLRVFHDFYRVGEESSFHFDIKETRKKGHDFKDYICPDSMEFESDYFKIGDRYGRVLFLREYASYIKDSMVAELTDLNRNLMMSIDVVPIPTDEAVREAESRLSWEDARYWVNSYIEDGVYLLPGEVAEQIDTDGMFKQLDLFTMFSEQVGNIAMKQAEEKSVMPTGFVLPEKQIDDILRSGGGRDDSRKRIYAKYQQRKTPEEMTAFLKKEYGTTGKGFEFDGKQIAVWFDEGGMRVGYGTSATEQPILTMEWKDIEQNIRRQVENGTYMGANEAYLVDEVERGRIANHLFFFFRDGMGEMPEELELKAGNYPDAHARLVELLSTPEEVERIAAHMDHALHQLETGEKSLRFRSVMPKEELRAELDNLLVDRLTFPAAEHVEIKHEDFITQEEIDHRLGRGSGFSNGSFRIYDYFKEGHDSKEAANFLKNEYGTGGSSHALAGADHSYEDHDAKGIKLKKGNIGKPYAEVLLSWKVVEKRIRKLIEEDKYLSTEGKEAYVQYRVEQEQKALEQAQAKMEHETKVACKNAIEKAIAEKFDGYRLPKDTAEGVIQEYGSERVSYVLANSVMHKRQDGRFSPENKEWAKAIEPYAMVKNEDMVVDSHPAVLNGFINQTRRYIEQEKELAAQAAEKITIDGQECIKVDEWGTEEETYVLGNSVTDKQLKLRT